MSDYVKLSELKFYLKVHPPAPTPSARINNMVKLDLLDLFKANEFNPASIAEDIYQKTPNRDKVFKKGDLHTLASYLWNYKPCAVFDYLSETLKQHGYTYNSPIHPCLVETIKECVRPVTNNFRELDDFLDVLDYHICKNPDTAILPEDYWLNDLSEALYYIKDHTEGFYPDKSSVKAPERAQVAPSLSSLAQEARSASDALNKGAVKQVERKLESR